MNAKSVDSSTLKYSLQVTWDNLANETSLFWAFGTGFRFALRQTASISNNSAYLAKEQQREIKQKRNSLLADGHRNSTESGS